ncbi:MAG: DUF3172 domain-containing protein [Nostoc sp.]|uniref:DUF3172 domain-containing protein n=1 Tax=Nostoc sp. TaxID=1180 RepID=UPI002FF010C9
MYPKSSGLILALFPVPAPKGLGNNDWAVLQQKNLVTSAKVNEYKQSLNTFAFTGKLENSPDIYCVYQNDAAGNLFINKPHTFCIRERLRSDTICQ